MRRLHSGVRHAVIPRAIRISLARLWFVRELERELRRDEHSQARAELDSISAGDERACESWARSHGVDAPCVISHLLGRDGYQSPEDAGSWVYCGEIPEAWNVRVSFLDRGPLQHATASVVPRPSAEALPAGLDDLADRVATRLKDQVQVQPVLDLVRQGILLELAATSTASDDRHWRPFHRSAGPLSADPMREDERAFLRRASDHWQSRVHEARALGALPLGPERDLAINVEWLVRARFCQHSLARIATDSKVTIGAVKDAIGRLADDVGLQRRRRGRPRR